MKTLQLSNLICAIWCMLFGNIPKRRNAHHLDDSPFSDNLNRIDIRFSYDDRYGLKFEWNTDPIFSHINLSFVTMFSPAFSVSSSCFFSFFQPPSFRAFNNLWIVPRRCFTPIGLIHLSLLLSSPFLSFFLLSLFFPLFFLSFSSFSSFLSLSPCRILVRRPPPCRTASDVPGLLWDKHSFNCTGSVVCPCLDGLWTKTSIMFSSQSSLPKIALSVNWSSGWKVMLVCYKTLTLKWSR